MGINAEEAREYAGSRCKVRVRCVYRSACSRQARTFLLQAPGGGQGFYQIRLDEWRARTADGDVLRRQAGGRWERMATASNVLRVDWAARELARQRIGRALRCVSRGMRFCASVRRAAWVGYGRAALHVWP